MRWESLGVSAIHLDVWHFRDLMLGHGADLPIADACVACTDYSSDGGWTNEVAHALVLTTRPDHVAMPDGRKWNAIPVIVGLLNRDAALVVHARKNATDSGFRRVHVEQLTLADDFGARAILQHVHAYRQQMLSELDNLGFIVTYQAGRYRLGPALKPRAQLSGHYYYGPSDLRDDRFVTIDRELLAIQIEVDEFEALINRADVSENDIQRFFEMNPHFLSTVCEALPHVRLHDAGGKVLIPDFILKPLVATKRDSQWEVLDLKHPRKTLLVGRVRRRLSHEVTVAIRQLRDYGDYFAESRNRQFIRDAVGFSVRRPRLAVLIGRLSQADVEPLEYEQARLPDVRLITYDEILEQQRALL